MTLDRRMQALLDLVEGDRAARCAAIAAEAEERARALFAQAHADARARMREAFAEEQERAGEQLSSAHAKLATRQRIHAQQRAAQMLALGMAQLPEALRRRWRDAAGRAAWIDAVATDALAVLPKTGWRISHPPDWPDDEQRALVARLAPALPAAPGLVADPANAAGLKVAAGGNIVDGTLAGLVADRNAVGSRLLGLLGDRA